jgi:hypothetical protein
MFHLNTDKFDFRKIQDSINRFYPAAVNVRPEERMLFASHQGLKELESVIVTNIHNSSDFKTRWGSFTKTIENKIQKPVTETTYGQAPCFSGYAQLQTFSADDFTRVKELHIFVSLVGPYYTVTGRDRNEVAVGKDIFHSTNYLVVSPENEYAGIFNEVCLEIEAHFEGFRFIPFAFCRQPVTGVYIPHADENPNCVFHALFNDHIDLSSRTIGDEYYKSGDWIREGYTDPGGWTMYPPV